MNISKATLSFDSMPQVTIGGQKKEFGELTINGKTFQGVDLGNGTFAKLKTRPDGKFDVKTFHGGGKDLSALSVKVVGGTVSRIKTMDGQRIAGAGVTRLKGETLRFNSDFASGYSSAGTKLDGKTKDGDGDDKTISIGNQPKSSDIKIGVSSEEKKKDWFEDKFFQEPLTNFFEDDNEIKEELTGNKQPSIKNNLSSIKNEPPDLDKLESLLNELSEPTDKKNTQMPDLKLPGSSGTPELDKAMKEIHQSQDHEKNISDKDIDHLINELTSDGGDIKSQPKDIINKPGGETNDGVETYEESKTPGLDKLIDKMNTQGRGFEINNEK